ncbi:MAG: aldo/keto reductase [Myxococcales bacterium]|nr:aldo/keto reductase [Myxococcales bacterium]
MNETKRVNLGRSGPAVFPVGLGCMGMSGMYGPTDDAESVATLRAALDAGIDLFDTGDFYGMGHNEALIAEVIAGRRAEVKLSVKFGALRGPDGAWLGVDNRPAAVKTFAAYSLKRLGVEAIDLYRPARLDPQVPIEDTIGAVADLVKAGYVKHIGLSEVGPDTIRRAQAVAPIADLQIEYSLVSRGPEARIFPLLHELGIGATLYGVLSRGLLSGRRPQGPADFRAYLPRFTGDAQDANARAVSALAGFAGEKDLTPAQLSLAYVLAKQPGFVPLLGVKTRTQLAGLLEALESPLSLADVSALEALVPPSSIVGTRYAPQHMAHLDSER